MKQYKLTFLLTFAILGSVSLYSQNWPCQDDVHGVFYHIHMDCTQDILITSLLQDTDGTIIRGVITTSETIIIKPGHSFVRILPDGTQSKGILTHTTKIKSNGNVGNKSFNRVKTKSKAAEELIVYPNQIKNDVNIRSTSNKIISYQIFDFYGKIIKEEKLLSNNFKAISVLEIKKGVYLLNIKFANGKQQIEKIIKQ